MVKTSIRVLALFAALTQARADVFTFTEQALGNYIDTSNIARVHLDSLSLYGVSFDIMPPTPGATALVPGLSSLLLSDPTETITYAYFQIYPFSNAIIGHGVNTLLLWDAYEHAIQGNPFSCAGACSLAVTGGLQELDTIRWSDGTVDTVNLRWTDPVTLPEPASGALLGTVVVFVCLLACRRRIPGLANPDSSHEPVAALLSRQG